jgi:hydroxyacylglutathione hydrolase
MNANDQPLYDMVDVQAGWLGMETPERTEIDVDAWDGNTLKLAQAEFQMLHTQGSTSVWIPSENKLVAGDTLFRDSIGRTDLPGGDERQILRSIHDKLLPLPDAAVVICGHGPNTTIGRERERNPFLRGL